MVTNMKEQLSRIQDVMSIHKVSTNKQLEREVRQQLEKWSLIEESSMQQKSRV